MCRKILLSSFLSIRLRDKRPKWFFVALMESFLNLLRAKLAQHTEKKNQHISDNKTLLMQRWALQPEKLKTIHGHVPKIVCLWGRFTSFIAQFRCTCTMIIKGCSSSSSAWRWVLKQPIEHLKLNFWRRQSSQDHLQLCFPPAEPSSWSLALLHGPVCSPEIDLNPAGRLTSKTLYSGHFLCSDTFFRLPEDQ